MNQQRTPWENWSDKELLRLRFRELKLSFHKTLVEECIEEVRDELRQTGLRFKPHFWLSTEWFCPDGVPGVAVPFFLAHKRLGQLEKRYSAEPEGATRTSCLKLLRHELGHAFENAYNLRRRRIRQRLFGLSSTPYPQHYVPNPKDKNFVLYLSQWYAQSHPDEDFAESFAVWLDPKSGWQRRYRNWPAIQKLEYIDSLVSELKNKPVPNRAKLRVYALPKVRKTLRRHYSEMHPQIGGCGNKVIDKELKRVFHVRSASNNKMTARSYLNKIKNNVRRSIARQSFEDRYAFESLFSSLTQRAHELELSVPNVSPAELRTQLAVSTAKLITESNYQRHRVAF